MVGMERHIELAHFLADLNRKIAETQALAKASDDSEERSRANQLLAELFSKKSEAKQQLRSLSIALGEKYRKESAKIPKRNPPPLTTGTIVRLKLLFKPDDQLKAREVLLQFSDQRFCDKPAEAERVWIAALKLSCGNLARLAKAIETANGDYRDLLLEAGFATDVKEHLRWWPGQPAPWYAPKLPPPRS
jgi:hypothetical protein